MQIKQGVRSAAAGFLQPLAFRLLAPTLARIQRGLDEAPAIEQLLSSDWTENGLPSPRGDDAPPNLSAPIKSLADAQSLLSEGASVDELSRVARAFMESGSDKSTLHDYETTYAVILRDLPKPVRILEIGIGSTDPRAIGYMGRRAEGGASLYAWKKLIPDARIFGADIDEATFIKEPWVTCLAVDQRSTASLLGLRNTLQQTEPLGLSMVVDDGLHELHANILTLRWLWTLVRPGGYYVVEDIESVFRPYWNRVAAQLPFCEYEFVDHSSQRSRVSNCLAIFRKGSV